ncbi:MAG: hypothetical protein SFZ23_08310 [Planctomycetota bacterium]|nr:hypothetical protein [Planctomycetota bacterium]
MPNRGSVPDGGPDRGSGPSGGEPPRPGEQDGEPGGKQSTGKQPGGKQPGGKLAGNQPGGIVHTYQKYDPKNFPSPTAPPPDIAGAAMEHMLSRGSLRDLTPEELARAIRIDPSMFPRLGPSLDSIAASLEERKRKILSTYETQAARRDARREFERSGREAQPPKNLREGFQQAFRTEQIDQLERLYIKLRDDRGDFAAQLMRVIDALGTVYQLDELDSKYAFTGRTEMSPEKALEVKAELEEIDRLLEQIKEAAKTAQLAIIDMESLSELSDPAEVERLSSIRQQIEDYLREAAQAQGLEHTRDGYRLTPQAMRLFQQRILSEVFQQLQAGRSGRHGPVLGDGPVELPSTKPYEFGDAVSSMDVASSFTNAMLRRARGGASDSASGASDAPSPVQLLPDDILIHRTRNTPRCATVVALDMSGSMRHDGQYINAKRMALGLDGLIRTEYPGDFLGFVEVFSLAKVRHVSELPGLMPKPVTIRQPVVRLRANMADPRASELQVPPHFTNLQQGLRLARQLLAVQDTPNKQVFLITDGLPTAHFEDEHLYLLYPPDPRTEEATMREARACARDGIVVNVFLLPNWWQSSEDVQFAHRMAEQTKGRVFFTAGKDLDRFVLWDYVSQRRKVIG